MYETWIICTSVISASGESTDANTFKSILPSLEKEGKKLRAMAETAFPTSVKRPACLLRSIFSWLYVATLVTVELERGEGRERREGRGGIKWSKCIFFVTAGTLVELPSVWSGLHPVCRPNLESLAGLRTEALFKIEKRHCHKK